MNRYVDVCIVHGCRVAFQGGRWDRNRYKEDRKPGAEEGQACFKVEASKMLALKGSLSIFRKPSRLVVPQHLADAYVIPFPRSLPFCRFFCFPSSSSSPFVSLISLFEPRYTNVCAKCMHVASSVTSIYPLRRRRNNLRGEENLLESKTHPSSVVIMNRGG